MECLSTVLTVPFSVKAPEFRFYREAFLVDLSSKYPPDLWSVEQNLCGKDGYFVIKARGAAEKRLSCLLRKPHCNFVYEMESEYPDLDFLSLLQESEGFYEVVLPDGAVSDTSVCFPCPHCSSQLFFFFSEEEKKTRLLCDCGSKYTVRVVLDGNTNRVFMREACDVKDL